MGRLEVVVYPKELDAAEVALSRLGWETVARTGDGVASYGVRFRLPCDEVTLELVRHEQADALVRTLGSDVIAGLCLYVDDADEAWRAARLAGLRLDPVCAEAPSREAWGRLVRTYAAGGLRLDFVQATDAPG